MANNPHKTGGILTWKRRQESVLYGTVIATAKAYQPPTIMKNEEEKKQKKAGDNSKRERKSESSSKVARIAANGEIQYGRTIGRHGIDDERSLNPEE